MGEEKVKLLGFYIDNTLNFDYHINQLCKRAGKKLHALTRVFIYMKISQRKLISNVFIMSQFSHCPLIWMFHSRFMEYRTNRIHQRTLRLIYPNQHQLTFNELLEKSRTVSIHQRNVQTLATKNKISPQVVNLLFEFTNKNNNLTNASKIKRKRYFTVHYGSESYLSLAPKVWKLVSDSIIEVRTLSISKMKLKPGQAICVHVDFAKIT